MIIKQNSNDYSINEWMRKLILIGIGISIISLSLGVFFGSFYSYKNLSSILINLGIISLLLTPVVRLLAVAFLMIKSKDFKYAFLSLMIVILIAIGLIIGKVG